LIHFYKREMSGDECDYMSDDFLAKLTKENDTRPGLKKSVADKREHERWKKREIKLEEQRLNKRIKKTVKEKEMEHREEGLNKELDSNNKGFAMLAKMGFKPGTSLGKTGTGITEPVGINIKEGRGGLGREAAVLRFKERKQRIMEQRAKNIVKEFDPAAYRAQMREKHMAKRTDSDLYKSQKSCRELDLKKEFTEPMETWFWPKELRQNKLLGDDEEEEEEEEEAGIVFTNGEQLEMVVEYLRTEHIYCVFCGISFYNPDDMGVNCPGPTRDDHDSL